MPATVSSNEILFLNRIYVVIRSQVLHKQKLQRHIICTEYLHLESINAEIKGVMPDLLTVSVNTDFAGSCLSAIVVSPLSVSELSSAFSLKKVV